MSFSIIGTFIRDNYDHTTVIYGYKKIKDHIQIYNDEFTAIEDLKNIIREKLKNIYNKHQ